MERSPWEKTHGQSTPPAGVLFGWQVPAPIVTASPQADWVKAEWMAAGYRAGAGNRWYSGFLYDDHCCGAGVLDPDVIVAEFDLNGYDIQAGDILTVSAQGISKILTISSMQVNDINLQNDTASGKIPALELR